MKTVWSTHIFFGIVFFSCWLNIASNYYRNDRQLVKVTIEGDKPDTGQIKFGPGSITSGGAGTQGHIEYMLPSDSASVMESYFMVINLDSLTQVKINVRNGVPYAADPYRVELHNHALIVYKHDKKVGAIAYYQLPWEFPLSDQHRD